MRAISFKIINYAFGVSREHNGALERRALHFIFMSFAALAVMYVLILGSLVFNIIERRNLEARAHAIESEVGELELTYLSLSGKVDLEYSHSLGFKDAPVKFAPRKSLGSLNTKVKNEI